MRRARVCCRQPPTTGLSSSPQSLLSPTTPHAVFLVSSVRRVLGHSCVVHFVTSTALVELTTRRLVVVLCLSVPVFRTLYRRRAPSRAESWPAPPLHVYLPTGRRCSLHRRRRHSGEHEVSAARSAPSRGVGAHRLPLHAHLPGHGRLHEALHEPLSRRAGRYSYRRTRVRRSMSRISCT